MARIDLDKARAARQEAKGEAPVVVLGGKEFIMPLEMPFEVVEKLGVLRDAVDVDKDGNPILDKDGDPKMDAAKAAAAILEMFKVMIGTEDQYREFIAMRPSVEDLDILIDGLLSEYGVELGESAASGS